jgi:hypothetical protein
MCWTELRSVAAFDPRISLPLGSSLQRSRSPEYEEPNAKPPRNLKLLQDRWNRQRGTASPTESEYEVAAHKLLVADNEGTIAEETSKLLKDYRVTEYRRATNLPFKVFPKNVGFNNGLSAAQ